jgi:quinoprotein glucose dehydrogenase
MWGRIAALTLLASASACQRGPDLPPLAARADVAAAEAGANEWPSYGGQPSSTKYSSLDQINRSTIARLRKAWTWHSGEVSTGSETVDATVGEMTPIYVNARLYGCTPYGRAVALDPATGREVWSFDPKKPRTGNMYHENYCRGVAYWQAADAATRAASCGKRILYAAQNAVLAAQVDEHAKAGNINHALTITKGKLIAIFDCDHIPTRAFLQMTVGWFLRAPAPKLRTKHRCSI